MSNLGRKAQPLHGVYLHPGFASHLYLKYIHLTYQDICFKLIRVSDSDRYGAFQHFVAAFNIYFGDKAVKRCDNLRTGVKGFLQCFLGIFVTCFGQLNL